MSYTKITLRYAAAFFDFTAENGLTEKAFQDMQLLGKISAENHEFVRMLQNPVIHADKKSNIIRRIFGNETANATLNFMLLMIRKRREKYLPSIAEAFTDLYKAQNGIKPAKVVSAVELDTKTRTGILEMLAKLTDKKIELTEKINPALLGGFVVNIDNYQIDQSIASKIKELKKDFEKNLFVKGF
jgi:F-type H+-transporting ATPase subunit delta